MFGFNKIKKYQIYNNNIMPFLYAIPIYSNGKKLFMVIDTGATNTVVTPEAIDGCNYFLLNTEASLITANGKARNEQVEFLFGLDEDSPVQPFSACAFIASNDTMKEYLGSIGADGLIGMDFLRLCSIDFRKLELCVEG